MARTPSPRMSPVLIYLSLGSNLGNRAANLNGAIRALEDGAVRIRKISSFYETEPVDFLEQPCFLNCAVEAETALPARELLHALQNIETRMGSKKLVPKGPRLIDMDILLYGDASIDTEELQVPHPRMKERRFVLAPLAEIAPGLAHPSWDGSVTDLLKKTPDCSEVRRIADKS